MVSKDNPEDVEVVGGGGGGGAELVVRVVAAAIEVEKVEVFE